MRLNEQRDALINGILDASIDLKYFRSAILRKMAAPYGDGSRSNMVNAETDVLPRLNAILDTLATTLEATALAAQNRNAYAGANHDGEWYVLDSTRRNINGGAA